MRLRCEMRPSCVTGISRLPEGPRTHTPDPQPRDTRCPESFDPDHLSGSRARPWARSGAGERVQRTGEPWSGCRAPAGRSQHAVETRRWRRGSGPWMGSSGIPAGSGVPRELGEPLRALPGASAHSGGPCDVVLIQRSLTRPHGSSLLHRRPVPCRSARRLSEASR